MYLLRRYFQIDYQQAERLPAWYVDLLVEELLVDLGASTDYVPEEWADTPPADEGEPGEAPSRATRLMITGEEGVD